MLLDSLFFPQPKTSYEKEDFQEKLVFIQHKNRQVPCIIDKGNSNIWLIFFHGNKEDLKLAHQLSLNVKKESQRDLNLVVVEYPGYGLYSERTNDIVTQIEEDALFIYNSIAIHNQSAQILLMGRSIGTGPVCYLASHNLGKGAILISAFSSFKKLAKDRVNILNCLVADRFKNYKRARQITIPTLLIHGKMDQVINYSHSQKIYDNLKSSYKLLVKPDEMTHEISELHQISSITQFIEVVTN